MIDRAPAITSIPDEGLPISLTPDGREILEERLRKLAAELAAAKQQLRKYDPEPQTVMTVRLPKRLHELLKDVSHENRTSLNRFCVTVLSMAVGECHA